MTSMANITNEVLANQILNLTTNTTESLADIKKTLNNQGYL